MEYKMKFIKMLSENPTPNPVGIVQPQSEIQEFINNMANQWNEAHAVIKKGFWDYLKLPNFNLVAVTKFMMYCLDGLIILAEKLIPEGANKKATVLSAFGALYDFVIPPILPFFLKPLSSPIKNFVINTLISLIIDFFVDKYNEGAWKQSAK